MAVPLTQKGLPAPPDPLNPGHFITGDWEATLRNAGFSAAQAWQIINASHWGLPAPFPNVPGYGGGGFGDYARRQQSQQPAADLGVSLGLAPGSAPAASVAALPTDPRLNGPGYAAPATSSTAPQADQQGGSRYAGFGGLQALASALAPKRKRPQSQFVGLGAAL